MRALGTESRLLKDSQISVLVTVGRTVTNISKKVQAIIEEFCPGLYVTRTLISKETAAYARTASQSHSHKFSH